jgi:hypothetical protein
VNLRPTPFQPTEVRPAIDQRDMHLVTTSHLFLREESTLAFRSTPLHVGNAVKNPHVEREQSGKVNGRVAWQCIMQPFWGKTSEQPVADP